MASQTTHYGKLEQPALGAGKLVVAAGTVKFVSSATVATIPVPMTEKVIYVGLSNYDVSGQKQSSIPWSTGVISSKSIIVQRATGGASGTTLWYEAVGW